ncbi:hypothetical protein GCM10010468_69950 [Actinocorallia longicatena]|uniref:Uncharacterized protein n=2 Tax=Actinocorallia longicatena TaxID=111803 RepID=A0ABP6QJL7_9ACTN
MRNRVMRRLVRFKAVIAFRTVTGVGSAPFVYSLDPAMERLLRLRRGEELERVTPFRQPFARLIPHALAISELYVRLSESANSGAFRIGLFQTESDAWWSVPSGRDMRPDAYVVLVSPSGTADHWWIEMDMGTERIPVIEEKVSRYLGFAHSNPSTPFGVIPRVVFSVPDAKRREQITKSLEILGDLTKRLVAVATWDSTPQFLESSLATERASE